MTKTHSTDKIADEIIKVVERADVLQKDLLKIVKLAEQYCKDMQGAKTEIELDVLELQFYESLDALLEVLKKK